VTDKSKQTQEASTDLIPREYAMGLLRDPTPQEQCLAQASDFVRAGDYRMAYFKLSEAYGKLSATVNVDALREALEKQMNEHDEEVQCLPSSVLRERGLVWLEGWFDLAAALSTKAPLSMEGLGK
jgi:hypothetical protein